LSDPIIIEWVNAAIQGNQDAFAEILYTFQDDVYNLCYRMLSERGEAEDATQEAFLRAYLNLERYDQNRSFKTWVMTIASNHCIDRIRKRRMVETSIDEPTPTNLALSSAEPQPEYAAVLNEQSQEIQALLEELPEDYRLAVVLRYWYEYSYSEIADVMETTESAIKSRLFRARKMLADSVDSSSTNRDFSNLIEEN